MDALGMQGTELVFVSSPPMALKGFAAFVILRSRVCLGHAERIHFTI